MMQHTRALAWVRRVTASHYCRYQKPTSGMHSRHVEPTDSTGIPVNSTVATCTTVCNLHPARCRLHPAQRQFRASANQPTSHCQALHQSATQGSCKSTVPAYARLLQLYRTARLRHFAGNNIRTFQMCLTRCHNLQFNVR